MKGSHCQDFGRLSDFGRMILFSEQSNTSTSYGHPSIREQHTGITEEHI